MSRGQGSNGWWDVFIPPVNQHPRSLICYLLGLPHLSGEGPLSRPLHGEAEGGGVPPPGRVLLVQVPGHGVGLYISSDLPLVCVNPRMGIKPSFSSVTFIT